MADAGEILNRHTREIILRSLRYLQQIEPFKSHFAELSPGLIDQLSVAFGAIIVGIQRGLTSEQTICPQAIQGAIREHVSVRLSQGLGLDSLIREYQVLSDQMLLSE